MTNWGIINKTNTEEMTGYPWKNITVDIMERVLRADAVTRSWKVAEIPTTLTKRYELWKVNRIIKTNYFVYEENKYIFRHKAWTRGWLSLVFFILVILTGGRWNHRVDWNCISLIGKNVEHIFKNLLFRSVSQFVIRLLGFFFFGCLFVLFCFFDV